MVIRESLGAGGNFRSFINIATRDQPIHEPCPIHFIDKNKKGGENNYDAQQKNQHKSSREQASYEVRHAVCDGRSTQEIGS